MWFEVMGWCGVVLVVLVVVALGWVWELVLVGLVIVGVGVVLVVLDGVVEVLEGVCCFAVVWVFGWNVVVVVGVLLVGVVG